MPNWQLHCFRSGRLTKTCNITHYTFNLYYNYPFIQFEWTQLMMTELINVDARLFVMTWTYAPQMKWVQLFEYKPKKENNWVVGSFKWVVGWSRRSSTFRPSHDMHDVIFVLVFAIFMRDFASRQEIKARFSKKGSYRTVFVCRFLNNNIISIWTHTQINNGLHYWVTSGHGKLGCFCANIIFCGAVYTYLHAWMHCMHTVAGKGHGNIFF
jgi:hypothetical protein